MRPCVARGRARAHTSPLPYVLAVLACSLVTATARADETGAGLRLDWTSPSSCPSASAVVTDAERIAGVEHHQILTASALTTQAAEGAWRVALTIRGEPAIPGGDETVTERAIVGKSCDEVAHAIAVVLALAMMDTPEAAPSPPDFSPPTSAPVLVIEPPPVRPPPTAERGAARRAAPHVRHPKAMALGAGLTTNAGTLPHVVPGTKIEAAWRPGPFRAALGLELYLPARVRDEERSSVGGDFRAGALTLRGCFLPVFGRFEVGACAGAAAEGMEATGVGGMRRHTISTGWIALRAGAFGAYTITQAWALVSSLELSAPLDRPRFVLEDTLSPSALDIFRPSAVAGTLAIGFEARFF